MGEKNPSTRSIIYERDISPSGQKFSPGDSAEPRHTGERFLMPWVRSSSYLNTHDEFLFSSTVLVLSKIEKNKRNRNTTATQRFKVFLWYLRTLHIVWSLVRRRATRRLTRLQTMYMYSVLKFSKKWWYNVKKSIYRNRNATATQPQILSI